MAAFSPQELACTAWVPATLVANGCQMIAAASAQLHQLLTQFTIRGLAGTVWHLAVSARKGHQLFDATDAQALLEFERDQPAACEPQSLAAIARTLSEARVQNHWLTLAVPTRAVSRVTGFNLSEIGMLAWAFCQQSVPEKSGSADISLPDLELSWTFIDALLKNSTASVATATAFGPLIAQCEQQGFPVRASLALRRLASTAGSPLEGPMLASAAASLANAGYAKAAVALLTTRRRLGGGPHDGKFDDAICRQIWLACGGTSQLTGKKPL